MGGDLWRETRGELRRQLGAEAVTNFFSTFALENVSDGRMELRTHDEMAALMVEKNYRGLVEHCAGQVAGLPIAISIHFDPSSSPDPALEPLTPSAEKSSTANGISGATVETQQLSIFGSQADAIPSSSRPPTSPQVMFPPTSQGAPPQNTALGGQTAFSAATTPVLAVEQPRPAPQRFVVQNNSPPKNLPATSRFEHFVVGKSNEFAHEACRAVVEQPGTLYNPLFLYGGVGLGKTHLMQAVGLASWERNPSLRVRYMSAETFVNDLISSISGNGMAAFRQRYRESVDLLLIDDIQFIAGKERTQEEFFHTFNALYQSGRQIVLTSDRMPQELSQLEERLVSRLTMGLIVDIQPPDFETRVAILNRKATQLGFDVDSAVSSYIATHIRANVRELHGALLRIYSYARMRSTPITLDIAREQLERVHREREELVTPDAALRITAEVFNVSVKELKGRKRVATIAVPRKVAMYVARTHTGASFPELGQFFGGRDHTTVMHAVKSVEQAIEKGDPLRMKVEQIERKLLRR